VRGRVLVVEDNPTNLDFIAYLLKAFGYAVVAAADGEEGLEAARRDMPDIILCDVQLPGIDGYEVARRLKEDASLRYVPLVAVTALAMVGDRERLLAAGFDGYIAKPIEPETFASKVQALLRSGRSSLRSLAKPVAPEGRGSARGEVRATILMIDDCLTNIDVVRSTLDPLGYRVIAAVSLMDALDRNWLIPPDLILCDIHMPDRNGFEAIRVIKATSHLRLVPFVFLSSTVWQDEDMRHGLSLGAVKFIPRPIEPQRLIAEIEECLEEARERVRARGNNTRGRRPAGQP
jgi:two-component system cell cycle response regulator